jgi:hypothetical protein
VADDGRPVSQPPCDHSRKLLKRPSAPPDVSAVAVKENNSMNYIFWLIGVVVVVVAILSFLGLR